MNDINKEHIHHKIEEISKSRKHLHEEVVYAKTRFEQDKKDFIDMVSS